MTRVLVVAPSWVGDAVLSQPLFARLHERAPGLILDILAPFWTLAVFRRMPEVANTISSPFGHGDFALLARRRLARQLSERGYDHAIVLPNSFKSALIPWFANIPGITGYRGEKRGWIMDDCRDLDEKTLPLMAERFAWLAQPAHEPLRRPISLPRLRIDSVARGTSVKRLGLEAAKRVIAFCPGAEFGPAKRWPQRHFAELARLLSARGAQVWLFGSGKDAAITAAIQNASGNICVDLAGKTALEEVIDLMSLASHVVTNDSGLMHVACAVGVPVTALYGSSSPGFTPPLSDLARVVWMKDELGLACSPCFRRECPLGHFACMNQLAPDRVLECIPAPARADAMPAPVTD